MLVSFLKKKRSLFEDSIHKSFVTRKIEMRPFVEAGFLGFSYAFTNHEFNVKV